MEFRTRFKPTLISLFRNPVFPDHPKPAEAADYLPSPLAVRLPYPSLSFCLRTAALPRLPRASFYPPQIPELDMIANLVANDALQYASHTNGGVKQSAFVQHHQQHHHGQSSSGLGQHHQGLSLEHQHMLATSNAVQQSPNNGLNAYGSVLPSSSSSSNGCSASCSPTSSDALNGLLQRSNRHHAGHHQHMNHLLRTCSEGESPLGVSGLLGNGAFLHNHPIKTEPLDVSGLMGINPINSNFHNMSLAGTSSVPSTPGLGGLSGINFNHHGGPRSAPNPTSHLSVPELSLSLNVSALGNSVSSSSTPKPRHRSSPHDSLMKCRYCPKKFKTEKTLETHKIECRLVRLHECTVCGKRFKARGGLQQHHRIHIQDKPYICKFCPKRFTQKSHVDQHERIHTGDKPFTCTYCGRHFRQRSQQLGHEATHAHSGVNLVPGPSNGRRLSPGGPSQIKQESSSNNIPTGPVLNDLAAMALSQSGPMGNLRNFDVQQALDMMSTSAHQ
ncbi:hypothetical protein L596_029410 [Steinernema carpocapsae]|uniref:C2H2-type domain-containing protein n=1 Tax=Steinernema carpocapsae TaxID=34508 RepID=A0A4U5LUJ7_STECR|nr:hypothetical protein L596_029410 [Steinernema carpocapsae]